MTLQEAILSYPGLADIDDNFIEKVLIDRSVSDGTVDYALAYKETCALCAADCYSLIINDPDFSEGKLSIKLSRAVMRATAISLYNDNGEPENAQKLGIGKGNSSSTFW